MLCAHMDELGFLVQHIEDEGFLRLAPVGYHDDRMLTDQVLEMQGVERAGARRRRHEARARRQRRGARARRSRCTRCSSTSARSSREETEALGVRVGDPITFVRTGMLLNGTRVFTGKAVDDRAGLRRDDRDDAAAGASATSPRPSWRSRACRRSSACAARARRRSACSPTSRSRSTSRWRATRRRRSSASCRSSSAAGLRSSTSTGRPRPSIGSAVPRRLTRRLEEAAAKAKVPFQREVLLGGRDRRRLDRAGRRGHAHRLRLDPLAPHPLGRRRRPPRRHGAVRRPAARVRRAPPARVIRR